MLLRRIPNKANPVQNQIFTIRPMIGPTYNIIALRLTNVTKAELENIQVKLRGKPVQTYRTGQRLQDINDHYKRHTVGAEWLFLYFQRTELPLLEDQLIYSLGTADLDTWTIEMKVNSASVDPQIEVYADIGDPREVGVITKIREYPQDFSQAGKRDIIDLPTGQAPIVGLHFATDLITELKVSVDSYDLVEEMPSTAVKRFTELYQKLKNVTGYLHVSMIEKGTPFTAYPTETVSDLRARVDLSAPASFDTIVETVDTFDGL